MKWEEFKDLLVGIGPETSIGRMVAIRAENDKDVLKRFTKDQHRIRNEWRNKVAKTVSKQDMAVVLEQFKQAFIEMAGK